MFDPRDLLIIHVIWTGPITLEQAMTAQSEEDYGIYQIYGTHETSGSDTLLYIGQANIGKVRSRGKFSARVKHHHKEWMRWNPGATGVYFGRLAAEDPNRRMWPRLIDQAEAVLIRKIGPPFNSARVKTLAHSDVPILVINHGLRHRLPECVSTMTNFLNPELLLKRYGAAV